MKSSKPVQLGTGTLASRSSAAPFRIRIEALAANGRAVRVDFTGVESVSPSFADELFGVLVRDHGLDWLIDRIRLVNASDDVLRDIAVALRERQRTRDIEALA